MFFQGVLASLPKTSIDVGSAALPVEMPCFKSNVLTCTHLFFSNGGCARKSAQDLH